MILNMMVETADSMFVTQEALSQTRGLDYSLLEMTAS
jgi:hypothetical protein